MNILYLVPKPNVGGLQTTLRSRIAALEKYGVQAEVVFFDHGEGEYIFKNVQHSFVESPADFKDKIMSKNYDYLSFIYSPEYLKHVPESFSGKIIYEVRGWNQTIAQYVTDIDKFGKVDGVICIAKYLKTTVQQHLTKEIPVFVDGNTVHPMFHYVRSKNRRWTDCPVPRKGHKIIAYIGRVESSKNWPEFVRICAKLRKTNKIEPWIICNRGTTRGLPKLFRKCERKGLKGIAKVIVHVPNHYMPELYSVIKRSGGCILSTSMREGLGNHILEPMACGLPVVSSNVPGKNEIIRHRHNGMLYKLGNTNLAARYVREVITNNELRNKLKINALENIHREYSQEGYVKRYLNILSQI